MSEDKELAAVSRLSIILAEIEQKRRDGEFEFLKIVITITSVLISFIATSYTPHAIPSNNLCLIKIALVTSAICLLLSVLHIYQNKAEVHVQNLKSFGETLDSNKSASVALGKMGNLLVEYGKLYKYSIHIVVFSFCLSILSLVSSVLF